MQNVFWCTGNTCSGKTTLTKKLEKILSKDFSVQVIEGRKFVTKLGGFKFRAEQHDAYFKKVVSLVVASSKQYELVLVAYQSPKQKHRNYARKMLNNKYHEIFLQCSDICRADRQKNKKVMILNKISTPIKTLYRYHSLSKISPKSFDAPLSSDLIINTEKETVDESVNNILNFIHSKIL